MSPSRCRIPTLSALVLMDVYKFPSRAAACNNENYREIKREQGQARYGHVAI